MVFNALYSHNYHSNKLLKASHRGNTTLYCKVMLFSLIKIDMN